MIIKKASNLINIPSVGKVEIISLVVTALLVVVNYLIGSKQMALGVAAG